MITPIAFHDYDTAKEVNKSLLYPPSLPCTDIFYHMGEHKEIIR